VIDAAVSGLAGSERVVLERLLAPDAQPRPDAVSTLVETLIRAQRGQVIQTLLRKIAEPARARWQRIALLAGFEGRRSDDSQADIDCSYGEPIELPARPKAFLALARSDDRAIAEAVMRVVRRLDWPGKPKPKKAPTPSPAALQERLAAGQRIYATMCASCHHDEGQGRDDLAPPLAGSKLMLGDPVEAACIVLNGKEGPVLMPPFAAALSDEEIAAVLTYVRQSWGNDASPVEPSLVRDARAASLAPIRAISRTGPR
jgi:mono/diheme cytochrome c family protein